MKNWQKSTGAGKRIWNFFASVKLSVVVLVLLAATSIIGTLIPQNGNPAMYKNKYGEFLFNIFQRLDLFDMYHSWWFQLLLLVLTVNIIVCSINRLSVTGKLIFSKTISTDLSKFERLSSREDFEVTQAPDDLLKIYEPLVTRKFAKCRIENTESGFALFAEKGRWTRLGVYAVHLSIVLLLFGGLIGSFFGFEGYVSIPEGESRQHITLKNKKQDHHLDFGIRCDQFDVSFYESGAPKEYRSTLSLIENDTPVLTDDILVNKPLRYKGINIFQSSYGTAKPKAVTLNFVSRKTGTEYQVKTVMGEEVDLPEGLGKFAITDFASNFRFNLGETFLGKLTPAEGESLNIMLPFHYPRFDRMRKGDVVISVADFERSYYTGLQVTRDPGVYVVYSGFILLIIGCYITFFMSHQRLCVAVSAHRNRSRVMVSGNADRNKFGMQTKIKKLSQALARI